MELVKGIPITKYCDDHRLTPRQRLELFIPVCQAVQHAHQKGIIHRDLKPSNVLLALYDSKPVPKIIDFGVAKATGPRLTEKTLFTELGQVLGTFEYMSPEQAQLNQLDIDTRSDIYALGVLLYELLTGTTPLERKRLKETPLLEVLRLIREEEPPTPSNRLSTTAELPAIAANRGLEPKKLSALLKGDLDWIVMKCLDKDRDRRYETANALALDLERYLHDEPVQARPPSAGYRLRKFVRRNKGPVLAASLVLLALVAGIAGATWRWLEATDSEANARLSEAEARSAEQKAIAERDITQAVNDFLHKDLLRQADIGNQPLMIGAMKVERNRNVTVRELLDRAAMEIEGKFANQELTEAAIRLTIGAAYRELGEFAKAQTHLERSLQLRTNKLGADHAGTMDSKNALGVLYWAEGKYEQARVVFQEIVAAYTAALGADHPQTLTAKHNLATQYQTQGDYDRAESLFQEVIETSTAHLGVDHRRTLGSKSSLAGLYWAQGKYDQAETHLKEVIAAQTTKLGADHPNTLDSNSSLAGVYQAHGKYDKAETFFKDVLKSFTAKLGADHPRSLQSKNNLGRLYQARGNYDRAEALFNEAHNGLTIKVGANHPDTLFSKQNLASLYQNQGKWPNRSTNTSSRP